MTTLDVTEWTIADLSAAMQRGEMTAVQLVQAYLTRIFAHNTKGSQLRAMESLAPQALATAKQLDEERMHGHVRGPLHGIPVVLKSNIDTTDELPTTAGSRALQSHYARRDAWIVARLREAGAIILGKAAMTEWANFMTAGMPSGYSSLNGQVKNPYSAAAEPGGSSSGCAVAVAANFCAGAIGTETARSIAHPASLNSIVGMRPTMGLVSRTGLLPLSVTRDIAGPMARSVYDVALLLNTLAGPDAEDPVTAQPWHKLTRDFTANLNDNTAYQLREMRIGVPRKGFVETLSADQLALFEQAIAALQDMGITIFDDIEIDTWPLIQNTDVLHYEFKGSLNRYLQMAGAPISTLSELLAYNETNGAEMLRYGQSILEKCEQTSGRFTEPEYADALARDRELAYDRGVRAALETHRLEALLFPSFLGAALAAKAEVPSVYVPAGFDASGVPFGIAFTGNKFSDDRLLQVAYGFEQRTKHRRQPQLEEDKK